MDLRDLTVETMFTMQRLVLLWAQINRSGFPGEELPGKIFDSLDEVQSMNTRLMELNGWTSGWHEYAYVADQPEVFPRRAVRIYQRVFELPESEWPELLAEAIEMAYEKGWESRVMKVGNIFITFAMDIKNGGVVFKTDLYRAFHMLTQLLALSDEEIERLAYKRLYLVFKNVQFRERRAAIFARLQQWQVIPAEEELED